MKIIQNNNPIIKNKKKNQKIKNLSRATHGSMTSMCIYIYKQRPYVGKHKVLPCGTLYEENWNTLKSYQR